jgi:hypothetical protein
MVGIGLVCLLCGKEIKKVDDLRGFTKHPICKECYEDIRKYEIWLKDLKKWHYDLWKEEMKV